MLRRISWFVVLAVLLAACATVVPAIAGLDVTPASASVLVGETVQLDATATGVVGTPDLSVTWSSDDETVATVDTDGLVTAVASGTANITATSVFDTSKSGSAVITVPGVGGVTVTPTSTNLAIDGTVQLEATLTGVVGSPDPAVTWSSDDEVVATVDASGLVTAHAVGTANIRATSVFDVTKWGTATVTVDSEPTVTDVSIDTPASTDLGVTASTTVDLDVTVSAEGGASTAVTWSSDDETVATVDADGVVTSVGAGSVTITATSDFDAAVSDDVVLTVHAAPTAPAYGAIAADAGTAIDQAPGAAATGGFGALSYALAGGSTLPEGLAVDSSSGAIQGTSYDIDAYLGVVVVVTDELGQQASSAGFDVDLGLVFEYLYTEVPEPYPNTFEFDVPTAGAIVVGGIYVYLNGLPAYVESDPIGAPGVFDLPNPLLPFTFSFAVTAATPGPLGTWAVNDAEGTLSLATDLTDVTYDDGPWTLTVTVTAGSGEQADGVAVVSYVGPVVVP